MGTVTLTTEEYEALLRLQSSERESEGARLTSRKSKSRRGRGRTAKGMGAALREANKRARKKNGEFRKGYDQKRVMQMAHKIRRSKK